MERLAFCALIKHMFKTFAKGQDFMCHRLISRHMETLALKCSPEIEDKKGSISGLKIKALDL